MAAENIGSYKYNRMEEMKEFDESKMGAKGLSDSGITSIPRFFIHSQETLADLKPRLKPSQKPITIPIIDLSNMNSSPPAHRAQIVTQVKEAATTWGFFQVTNHGVSQSVLDSTIKAIKSFHEKPHETKSPYYKRGKGPGIRYHTNDDLFRARAATWHDTLQVFIGSAPHIEEEELPEVCRKEVVEWDVWARMVAEMVMELLSEGLGLEAGKLKELTLSGYRVMLGHYYPWCPQPDLTLGITSHTDNGGLTVLLQNQVGGLQVRHGDDWVDVMPVHGGLVINIGDFLQIVYNGEYKSVQHRVLANSSKEPRISIADLFSPSDWQASGSHGPLPELVSPEKPALYRNFTHREVLQLFYDEGLVNKSLVDKFKLVS
ncbi:hypothetical protein Tsubulata_001337 [Turnera subulata]|uniref:Fe2OG dioxygenase domain-containing protein n=1 Tax=Turnera subulata TaxID=218843 RepID=A0A9Q0FGU6_9ROSI|nr:hypothetical protein Tsubulata_001337 [Turnera subulata]